MKSEAGKHDALGNLGLNAHPTTPIHMLGLSSSSTSRVGSNFQRILWPKSNPSSIDPDPEKKNYVDKKEKKNYGELCGLNCEQMVKISILTN